MSTVFAQLEEIIDAHLLTEKRFIVPSHRDGQLAIQALARRKKAVINVKVKTFFDLAVETAAEIIKKRSYQEITFETGKQLIYQSLKELKTQKELNYFHHVQLTPSFVEAVYKGILVFKKTRVSIEHFPTTAFLKEEKGNDLAAVYSLYEQKRRSHSFIDEADIFELALQTGKSANREVLFVFFPHEAYDFIEKEFFFQYTKEATVIPLILKEVHGVETPRPMFVVSDPHKPLHLEEEEQFKNVVLKTAIDEEEELKSIIRTIKKDHLLFDQTAIYYTSQKPYVDIALRLMEKEDIPMTFAEGFPIGYAKIGKLLKGFFRWIREDYTVKSLAALIREDCLITPFNGERVIQLLQELGIRWGRERYIFKIEEKLTELKQKQATSDDKNKYEQIINDYVLIRSWVRRLFSLIPVNYLSEPIAYHTWLKSIKELVSSHAKCQTGLDVVIQEQVLESLAEELVESANELLFHEAIMFSEQWLLALTVGASMPKPGHLHLSPHRIGLYVDRINMFIVGVDSSRFPGRQKEDPVLLDVERKAIHPEMTLEKAYVKRNFYLFVQLLLTANKPVQLSYPYMSLSENRKSSPAHLYLQLYRNFVNNREITSEELTERWKKSVHFFHLDEKTMLSESEWLISQVWQERFFEQAFLKETGFEHVVQSLTAKAAREEGNFTEYDGRVEKTEQLDPRKNEQIMVTASKLELLGTCPYAYFLRYVLSIPEEREEKLDLYRWLDAPTRGTVLHNVFERFYRMLQANHERPIFEQHINDIVALCDEVLLEEKEGNPPPNEIIFELERQELLESCFLFLKAEEETSKEGEPLFFEHHFGLAGQAPAVIELTGGETLQLSGKIDRVDKRPDGTLAIIDYKTGSSYGYDENSYFHGGRKLQHSLYALALEALFTKSKVSEAVYYFPTLKGQGQRVVRVHREEEKQHFLTLVNHLCEMVKNGHFPYTDDANDCTYCDYKIVCSRHHYKEDTLVKKQEDKSAESYRLKEVRNFD